MRKILFEIKCWLFGRINIAWTDDDEGNVYDHAMYRWVFLLLVGLLALAAVSCAPTRERCERAYGLCGQSYTDTILQTRIDTIHLAGDTLPPQIFDPLAMHAFDTLRFAEGRFKAQIIRDTVTRTIRLPGDTITRSRTDTVYRLSGGCDPDTIYRVDSTWTKMVNRYLFRPSTKREGGGLMNLTIGDYLRFGVKFVLFIIGAAVMLYIGLAIYKRFFT